MRPSALSAVCTRFAARGATRRASCPATGRGFAGRETTARAAARDREACGRDIAAPIIRNAFHGRHVRRRRARWVRRLFARRARRLFGRRVGRLARWVRRLTWARSRREARRGSIASGAAPPAAAPPADAFARPPRAPRLGGPPPN